VAPPGGGLQRRLFEVECSRRVASLDLQRSEVEHRVRIAARLRLLVPVLGRGEIATRFEEHAKVERGTCMGRLGRLPVRGFRGDYVATLLEQQAEFEPLLSATVNRERLISVFRHAPNAFPLPPLTLPKSERRDYVKCNS
jgi:hypothetical protein